MEQSEELKLHNKRNDLKTGFKAVMYGALIQYRIDHPEMTYQEVITALSLFVVDVAYHVENESRVVDNTYTGKITDKMREAESVVDGLAVNQRRAITYDQVAEVMQISKTAAHARLRHCRDKMKGNSKAPPTTVVG